MIAFLLLFQAAAAAISGVHMTVLPSEPPMITTSDHWSCATKEIPSYFLPPRPTGSLSSARLEYGNKIQTCTKTGIEALDCPFPDKSLWCGFSTAVPTTLLDEYIAYGSTASSWWAARSSAAVSLARACPHTWWTARDRVTFGATALNLTIIEAECYTDAHPTPSEPDLATSTTAEASSATIPPPTQAPEVENSVARRGENMGIWLATGTGLAFGAASSLL